MCYVDCCFIVYVGNLLRLGSWEYRERDIIGSLKVSLSHIVTSCKLAYQPLFCTVINLERNDLFV